MIVEPNKFGKADIDDIKQLEGENEISFPKEYFDFLNKYNGGRPQKTYIKEVKNDVNWFFGLYEEPAWASFYYALDTFVDRIPSWYIPIARMEGGDLLIMSLYEENLGVIAYWEHEKEAKKGKASQYFDNLTMVANSFSELLKKLE